MLRNSEEEGLQLLGPENVAIVKVRIISIFISTFLQNLPLICCKEQSGIFALFFEKEPISFVHEVKKSKIKIVFSFLPLLSLVMNGLAKMASIWMNKKLKPNLNFSIENRTEEKFSVSLNALICLPILVFFSIIFSYSNRDQRLLFYFPLQIMMLSVIIPSIIVTQNEKMKRTLYLNHIKPRLASLVDALNRFKNRRSSRVSSMNGNA